MAMIEKYTEVPGVGFLKVALDEHGQPRNFIILNNPESKRYASYIMMKRDLDITIEAIEMLSDEKRLPILQQSLLFLAVTTYGKCFVENKGERPKLIANKFFKDADPKLKEEHERIMSLRHDYVAHAGTQFDKCVVTGTLMTLHSVVVAVDVNSQLLHTINMPPKLNDFEQLCKFVLKVVIAKSERALNRIREIFWNMDQAAYNQFKIIKPDPNKLHSMEIVSNGDGSIIIEFVPVNDN